MEGVYFKKQVMNALSFHAGTSVEVWYFPEQEMVLYRETSLLTSDGHVALSNDPRILEEARSVALGNRPQQQGIVYSVINTFCYHPSQVRSLLKKARSKEKLESVVESGMDALLAGNGSAKKSKSIIPLPAFLRRSAAV